MAIVGADIRIVSILSLGVIVFRYFKHNWGPKNGLILILHVLLPNNDVSSVIFDIYEDAFHNNFPGFLGFVFCKEVFLVLTYLHS